MIVANDANCPEIQHHLVYIRGDCVIDLMYPKQKIDPNLEVIFVNCCVKCPICERCSKNKYRKDCNKINSFFLCFVDKMNKEFQNTN